MTLGDSLRREKLRNSYNKKRSQADRAREEGSYREAARYYRKCGDILDQIVDIESSDRVASRWGELADNMRDAAESMERKAEHGGQADASRGGETTAPGEEVPATQYLIESPAIDFGDVGGMESLKETLRESVIDPLERPDIYDRYGLGVVNGVLLYGPPGTGKTYITRALAGKLDYNYIELEASDLSSSLVGEAAKNVAEVFEVAKESEPCLVFLDEIDSIATERSGGHQKTMSESQMITQFLTEMSGLGDSKVVFIAATNLPDEIDGAAWRRFDKRIEVPPPDADGREAVMRIHLQDRPVDRGSLDWDRLRGLTDGYTPSDLEILVDEAARNALVETDETGEFVHIGQRHVVEAIDEVEPSLEQWKRQRNTGS